MIEHITPAQLVKLVTTELPERNGTCLTLAALNVLHASAVNLSLSTVPGACRVRRAQNEGFRIDLDLDHARREAERVRDMLQALRRRHDLSRYEYTRIVRIVPGGDTFSHPMLTLGNRFAEHEDLLLSTYLHEQMHWYLWYLGTPEQDPVAPFLDELVRRYPEAPTDLPDGARNYESTYLHLVINWLEVAATSEFIGRVRACAVAEAQRTYRWIYRLNPNGRLIEAYRYALIENVSPPLESVAIIAGLAVSSLAIGYFLFKKMEGSFADYI